MTKMGLQPKYCQISFKQTTGRSPSWLAQRNLINDTPFLLLVHLSKIVGKYVFGLLAQALSDLKEPRALVLSCCSTYELTKAYPEVAKKLVS